MHELTGNQDAVLEVLRRTIHQLGQDALRKRQTTDNEGMHGFALLTLNGANMQIEYIDRDGVIAHTEDY